MGRQKIKVSVANIRNKIIVFILARCIYGALQGVHCSTGHTKLNTESVNQMWTLEASQPHALYRKLYKQKCKKKSPNLLKPYSIIHLGCLAHGVFHTVFRTRDPNHLTYIFNYTLYTNLQILLFNKFVIY